MIVRDFQSSIPAAAVDNNHLVIRSLLANSGKQSGQ